MRNGSKHALLIRNPAARRPPKLKRLREGIEYVERHGWSVRVASTRASEHARELATEAAAAGMNVVIVCGGDGTINEAVNGLAGSQTALAVLPAGTVNIWARETSIPRDPLDALRLLVEGERRRVDLGCVQGRNFLMLASVGTDSYAVAGVTPALKRRWGQLGYLVLGLRDLFRTGGRPMTVELDGETINRRVLVAIVGNTRLYGGMLRSTSEARIDDGLLDLCLYTGEGWRDLALHAIRTLAGRHLRHPSVVYRRSRGISVSGPTTMPFQVDGESAGYTPVTFTVSPDALTVIVPRGRRSRLFTAPPV